MKKILAAFFLIFILCGTGFADGEPNEFGYTPNDIYKIAKTPSGDPLVGVWEGYLPWSLKGGKTALFAIIPDEKNARPEWEYLVFSLDDTSSSFKIGELRMLLRRTAHAKVLFAKTVEKDVIIFNTEGPVLFDDGMLDFARLPRFDPGITAVILMMKSPGSVPEWYVEPKPDNSALWDAIKPKN